ncbi:hypothetical protein IFR05_004464 [Cadophora sp. M221]|nr:hypothetical protein IFR05_004464 [Cadophora sp. M221]
MFEFAAMEGELTRIQRVGSDQADPNPVAHLQWFKTFFLHTKAPPAQEANVSLDKQPTYKAWNPIPSEAAMSSPTVSFNLPGLATTDKPVFTSNSPVCEILSPRPIRRVSMVSVMHLANVMEATFVPPPPPPTRATTMATTRHRLVAISIIGPSFVPPPPTRATTINTIRRKPVPNRNNSELLFGSEPDYDDARAKFGVIGGERRVKNNGGDWL